MTLAATPIAAAGQSDPGSKTLPPPNTNPGAAAEFINNLLYEAVQDDRRIAFEQEMEEGLNQYLGYHWQKWTPFGELETEADDGGGFVRLVLNRTQNCVVGLMAIQAGDPPKITFTARESGEPGVLFVNTNDPSGQSLAAEIVNQLAAQGGTFDPTKPIPAELAEAVRQEVAEGEAIAAQLRAANQPVPPDLATRDSVIEVTEFTATEALQTVFDAMWEAADCNFTFVENVLNKNVLGWQPTLYEFDDDEKRHILKNVHPKQVFVDPIESDYALSQYTIYDEPISADEAAVRYPALAAKIREWADAGPLQFPGSRPYSPGYRFTQPFRRDMVVIRHCWIRNQPYPMTPDEAVAAGRVMRQDVPDGDPVTHVGEDGTCPGCGHPNAGALLAGGYRACPGCGEPFVTQPTRPAHFRPDTGDELPPTLKDDAGKDVPNPKWPVKYLIRQLRIIHTEVVDDRPCEFSDIPVPWNVNLPIPFSPYGQGEPKRIKGLQDALNQVLSSLVTYARYNACPPEVISSEVHKLMDAALQTVRTRPNQRVIIPQKLLEQLGGDIKKVIGTIDPAAMPADFWKLLDFLVQMIDKEGNQADVTQGNASSTWSGDAITALQNAASQVVRAKSIMTEFYLKRLARLMVHSILYRMTPRDWARYCKKYPIQALEALHAKNIAIDINISVQIKSGSGASKQQQSQNILGARQAGVPVSPQTVLENLNLDADVELKQTMEWQRQVQQMAGPMAAATAPPAPASATNNGANT